MEQLKGRVAVVTGGASGIGRALCLGLAEAGAHVLVADLDADAAAAVATEAVARGVRGLPIRTDVSLADDVDRLRDAAYEAFGRVDILCNNAGVAFRPQRAIWDTSREDFDWMIGVNILGVVNGVRAFVPRMREQPGDKHIVNTSSMVTLLTRPGTAAYSMTKHAVDGFSDVIRAELREHGFGVTVVHAGKVSTRIESSARLRTPAEQAANAATPTYAAYATAVDPAAFIGDLAYLNPVTPAAAAERIIAAIREDRPYCLTHPPPVEALRARAEALAHAFP